MKLRIHINLNNHPVVGISWYEALAFVRFLDEWAHSHHLLPDNWHIGLPNEAEWEKAARGGVKILSSETPSILSSICQN